jgi:PAS domain S-box-containing protein
VTSPESPTVAEELFAGDGEMRGRCREMRWADTPLGPVERWPTALRTMVRTCLESPFPINLWCGSGLVLIYNDAYRQVLGSKHPWALGQPGDIVWAEIWDRIAPLLESIRSGGPAAYFEDAPFVIERVGGRAAAWFTYSLSPVRDEQGAIVAFLNIVSETTRRIAAESATSAALAVAERAESRLREVFEHTPSFLAVLSGPELIVEMANDAYYGVVGQRPLIGLPLFEAMPEARGQGFEAILGEVYRTGTPFIGREMPAAIRREPDGPLEQRFVDAYYIPILEADGSCSRIIVHGADVTAQVDARREVERLLAQSEADAEALRAAKTQLESVLGSISDAFFALDRAWRFTYVNDRAAQMLERARDEILGRNIWEQFAPAVGSVFEREYRRAMDTRVPVVFEEYYAPIDGWFEVRAYPSPEGIAVYFQDVTRRRRAAAALAESEARFRAVQDASPDASVLARAVRDGEGRIVDLRITYANAASQRILIGGPESVIGRTMREEFPESVDAGRLDAYIDVIETGVPLQRDVFYSRGSVQHGLRITVVKVGDGVHLSAADLSERLSAEADRERLLAEAEQARAEAEEANRAKSQFLTTMSHELRTPLNAIGGYADLLLLGVRGELSPAQRDDLTRMKRNGQHLLGLINDILNFARIEAGQVEFRLERVALTPLVTELEDLIHPQMAARAIHYRRITEDRSLAVRADAEKVRQILLNLLANAIKFTAEGGDVELSCAATEDHVMIRVRDTGRGIAIERLSRIFDPFMQVDRHLTPAGDQGIGLGLAISRDLAVGMGGELTVTSEPDVGSTFTLTLARMH